MGDHGGRQKELGEVAQKLGEKYASKGIRVVFCDEVYKAANDQFDKYLTAHNLPLSKSRRHPGYLGDALPRRR
jgi:hypothetical protein